MRISLVSMPGGGKSTVGRQLAKRLRLPFRDTDSIVEERIGTSIREFFEAHGEPAFRDVESKVLEDVLTGDPGGSVVSTGGGIVLRPGNRELLRAHSTVIYLHNSPHELYRRLRHDTKRPLLQGADPLGRLQEMALVREPLYRETAHFVLETGRPSVPLLVNMILMQLELTGQVDPDAVPSPVELDQAAAAPALPKTR